MNNSRIKKKIIPEKIIREIVEFFKEFMMEEAKFQRQSKLAMNTSSNLELPKFSEIELLSQLLTCLGFLEKQPTCAVITPPGFKILFKPFMFFAARSIQYWSSLRSTKILSYFESLTFLILSKASPQ